MAWHRPFCVDLEESTFTYLRNFLESYCDGISNDTPPAPFVCKRCDIYIQLAKHTHLPQGNFIQTKIIWISLCLRDHHHFILLCMKLLSIHLSLAHAGGTGAMVLGAQGRPLRNLLFRLIDTDMPDSIQQVSGLFFCSIPTVTYSSRVVLLLVYKPKHYGAHQEPY